MTEPEELKYKCLKCRKDVLGNSICCDDCDGWLHLKCSGLTKKIFEKEYCNSNKKFSCKYCLNYRCGKCDKPVYEQNNSIQCDSDSCQTWYHLKCTHFSLAEYQNKKSRLHTEHWFCPKCTCVPFEELSQADFLQLNNDARILKEFFSAITSNNHYSDVCSICEKKIKSNHTKKSFPCTSCNAFIHRKCTGFSTHEMLSLTPKQLKYWNCYSCSSFKFPLTGVDDEDIARLAFNSNFNCKCNDSSENIPLDSCKTFRYIDSFLPKDSPLITGIDSDIDNVYDINSKCDYYTLHDFHKLTRPYKDKQSKPFSALHTNIQSLMHNFDSLESLCTNLDYSLDIIAVSETWNADKNKDKFIPKRLDGYDKYLGIRGTTLKSGCGLYLRSGMPYKERKDLEIKHCDDINEFQLIFIEISVPEGANIIVGVTYRHPKNTSDNTFNTQLQTTLETISKEHKIVMLLGDFNYDLFRHDTNPMVKRFIEVMYSNNLQPTINKPTRVVKGQTPSLIDNIFTNAVDKDIVTGNLIDKISDHMPNFIIMRNMVFHRKKLQKRTRCWKNFDENKYNEDINEIDLTPVILNHSDANEIYTYFHNQYINVVNKHAPFVMLTNKQLHWKQKPWISKRIQNMISEKENLYKKFIQKNKDIFWYKRYTVLKKSLEKTLKLAKKEYFQKYFKENLHNSRKIWKGIKEIIHNRFRKDAEIYLDDNGNIITDHKLIANKFNKFYTNVAQKLLKDLGETPTKFQDYLRNPNEHSMFFNETDPGEVSNIISKLDVSKSGDIYGITPKLVKCTPGLARNLSLIFNLCIEQGIFPHLLKRAKVIPVYKNDSKMVTSNYRPISLLPIFDKIFERIMYDRLITIA